MTYRFDWAEDSVTLNNVAVLERKRAWQKRKVQNVAIQGERRGGFRALYECD